MTDKPDAGEAARRIVGDVPLPKKCDFDVDALTVARAYLSSATRIKDDARAWELERKAADDYAKAQAKRIKELEKALPRLKQSLDAALNDHLCEMKEGWDDSISGFNDAWDIMRKKFDEALARAALKEPTDGK